MPTITLGSMTASIFQFVVIVAILGVFINTHTTTGQGPLPGNTIIHLGGLSNTINQSAVSTTNSNSLMVQMGKQFNQTANSISPGILQTLGGLAFIPAAFGSFMNSMFNLPGNIMTVFQTLGDISSEGVYALLPFSIMAISSGFMAFYTLEFVYKMFTPITKTEMEDV